MARAGLEVALEVERPILRGEGDITLDPPMVACGGRVAACVVVGDALAEVVGVADVADGGN